MSLPLACRRVSALIPEEPWFACTQLGETERSAVTELLDTLTATSADDVSPFVRRQ